MNLGGMLALSLWTLGGQAGACPEGLGTPLARLLDLHPQDELVALQLTSYWGNLGQSHVQHLGGPGAPFDRVSHYETLLLGAPSIDDTQNFALSIMRDKGVLAHEDVQRQLEVSRRLDANQFRTSELFSAHRKDSMDEPPVPTDGRRVLIIDGQRYRASQGNSLWSVSGQLPKEFESEGKVPLRVVPMAWEAEFGITPQRKHPSFELGRAASRFGFHREMLGVQLDWIQRELDVLGWGGEEALVFAHTTVPDNTRSFQTAPYSMNPVFEKGEHTVLARPLADMRADFPSILGPRVQPQARYFDSNHGGVSVYPHLSDSELTDPGVEHLPKASLVEGLLQGKRSKHLRNEDLQETLGGLAQVLSGGFYTVARPGEDMASLLGGLGFERVVNPRTGNFDFALGRNHRGLYFMSAPRLQEHRSGEPLKQGGALEYRNQVTEHLTGGLKL